MKKFCNFKCKVYPCYEKSKECVICLENLSDKDIHITRCGHCYHVERIQKYYNYNNYECPLCRKKLQ